MGGNKMKRKSFWERFCENFSNLSDGLSFFGFFRIGKFPFPKKGSQDEYSQNSETEDKESKEVNN